MLVPSHSVPQVILAIVKKIIDPGFFHRLLLPHILLVAHNGHIAYVSHKEFSGDFCCAF